MQARERPERFAELYRTYREPILSFFAREVLDPETAIDLMGEAFAQAFRDIPKFAGDSDEEGRAWLWSIARHLLYRWRERGVVERVARDKLGIAPVAASETEFEHVEALIDLGRLRPKLQEALMSLSDDQRDAVNLRIVEERPYPEIAHQLGVSETVARARVSRGLRTLADLLRHTNDPTPEALPE